MQDDNARDNWDRFQRDAERHGYVDKNTLISPNSEVKKQIEQNDIDCWMKEHPEMFAAATPPDFSTVREFERRIAEFFGAPFAVAVDSCTHGLELCLRYRNALYMHSPTHTYLSIPMLAKKLNLYLNWRKETWQNFYHVTTEIVDGAVMWGKNWYSTAFERQYVCLSFQYQKHLSLGRGGMILCPDEKSAADLRRLAYDGREPGVPWRNQNIKGYGFHYYMTPDTARLGLDKLYTAIATQPRIWSSADYPDISQMDVFKKIPEPPQFPSDRHFKYG